MRKNCFLKKNLFLQYRTGNPQGGFPRVRGLPDYIGIPGAPGESAPAGWTKEL